MILSIWGVTIPIYLVSSTTDSFRQCVVLVVDDFGYICLDKGKRKLVNVVDTFQAQHGDKSRATP